MFRNEFREHEIRSLLCEKVRNIKIIALDKTGSTNDDLKKAAREGENEICLLVADSQTAGKGRKGRSFFSPDSTGIYMSFLLRPELTPEAATLLTTAAAAATAVAIEKITGISAGIKWVNDIFIGGRKVAGILTEGSASGDRLLWAVVGIGINLSPPQSGFPEEIRDIAGTLCENADEWIRNRLIAEITELFLSYCEDLQSRAYLESYRSRLFFLGREVTVTEAETSYTAVAEDIDSMCRLKVRLSDGSIKTLLSGEISIKL